MPETNDPPVTMELVNALVTLHKDQFGRGPTRASARFAGPNALLVVLEDALLPAERALVDIGQAFRVVDTRNAFQMATRDRFVTTIERITSRRIKSFAGGVDAATGTVYEVCVFEPDEGDAGD